MEYRATSGSVLSHNALTQGAPGQGGLASAAKREGGRHARPGGRKGQSCRPSNDRYPIYLQVRTLYNTYTRRAISNPTSQCRGGSHAHGAPQPTGQPRSKQSELCTHALCARTAPRVLRGSYHLVRRPPGGPLSPLLAPTPSEGWELQGVGVAPRRVEWGSGPSVPLEPKMATHTEGPTTRGFAVHTQ